MGILKDKEVDKIILNTCDYADAIITVAAPGNPRAMSSCELAEVVRRVHENVTAADSPEEAVEGTPSGRERGCYHRFWLRPFWGISSESRKRGSSEKSGSGRSGETRMVDKAKIEEAVKLLLEGIGEDVNREGLVETPQRIARMYEEIFGGMDEDPAVPLSKQFQAEGARDCAGKGHYLLFHL